MGRAPSEEELRQLRMQTLSGAARAGFAVLAVALGAAAWLLGSRDFFWLAALCALAALACLFFAIIGVRRTADAALKQMGDVVAEVALRTAARVVMRLFD